MFKNISIKKAIIILIIIAVILGGGLVFFTRNKDNSVYTTAKVTRGSIIQTVSETGAVKAASEINLSFLNSGRLAKKYFSIGDKVKKDDLLAELDYSGLLIKQNEAQANLDVANQNLNKIIAGATNSEIAVKQASVDQARSAYDSANNELAKTHRSVSESIAQAQKTLSDLESRTALDVTTYEQAITSAQTALDNAKSTYQKSIDNYTDTALATADAKIAVANTALDVIDRTIKDEDADDLISVKVPHYLADTKTSYSSAVSLVTIANSSLSTAEINGSEANVIKLLDDSSTLLNKTFEALQNCFSALENSVTSSAFTLTELDTFKTNISTQKTNVSTAISSVQSAKQNLNDAVLAYKTNVDTANNSLASAQTAYNDAVKNARNALSTAEVNGSKQIAAAESAVSNSKRAWDLGQAQLTEMISPANRYDIALSQAKVRQAQAALDTVNQEIENSKIISPIDGTITKSEFEVGEQISPGVTAISVLGENNFEIEVLISEADIAKVTIEDKAEVTLDAFGEEVKFSGKITFIEPAETEIQDVVYYKVTASFNPEGKPVKSGMTANVVITTAERQNVLTMPNRAVIDKNGQGKFTRVLNAGKIQEKAITLGLLGDGGITEVLSGVNEGEEVVTYVKEEKK